jgi:cardiolipin synthase
VFWRDTHLRIEGEAVKSLQINFFTTWDFVSNTRMEINKTYFPEVKIATDTAMQIASSGPDTDTPKIMEAIFLAIATAKKYVYITTPYFVPNDQIITALLVAAKSDVDVRVLIPKISDSWVVQHATNSYLEQLLAGQVKIYKYTKGFIHAKTLVVDDLFSTIGTSNMDYRSFNINFEINAFIYNKDHSKELKEHFLEDLKDSEQIRQEDWNTRSKLEKFKESYCRLWSPLI